MEAANDNVRLIAAEVVADTVWQGKSLSQTLPMAQQRVAPEARARLQDLCFGSCRWWHRLHAELDGYLRKPLKASDRVVEALLIVALYQLRHTRTPAHAVVSEAVETCRDLGKPYLSGLVNGVLRSAEREGEPDPANIAIRTSHPEWLATKLQHNWPDQWESILDANNVRAPMTLRINARHGSREGYLQRLATAGIAAHPCVWAPCGIQLAHPCPVNELPGFDDGDVSVQDEAAQLCGTLLAPQAGQRVLDACAAPGGKTCALLEQVDNLEMVALDQDDQRLDRLRENLARLDLKADIRCADAAALEDWWDGRLFDRILLDAPCSATGVIRRHPDIKLLRRETDILPLSELQLRLLRQLWTTLAPGGRLLYATCSVFPQENQRIITRFLRDQSDARVLPLAVEWGLDTGDGRQLLPTAGGHDGFFYAYLEKTAGNSETAMTGTSP